jgi:hypothetical protein
MRRYVLAAIAIFALIGGIVFLGWRQRGQLLTLGVSTPTVAIPAGRSGEILAERQPSSKVGPSAGPSSMVAPPTQHPTPEACPLDPKEWQLLEIAPNDNFKRITPFCVYDGLARTVAWDLLRVSGYSAPEATEALGFGEFPRQPEPEITGLTNTRGPMTIELEYAGGEVKKQVGRPDFRTWIVDQWGNPGIVFTLRGCYRTETVQGSRVESWGVAYPVLCVVSADQMDWALLELGSHHYAVKLGQIRQFSMYGYAGGGLWVSIGYQKEPLVEIRLPGASQPAVLPLTMDLEEIVQDRTFISGLHALVPWDAAWLEATFGLSMRPLPENWQSFNDPAELQAIQTETGMLIERRNAP